MLQSTTQSPTSKIITLMTDFGLSDTYVGVMKGVILGIAPHARIVDLTHDIAPQNLVEATVKLTSACRYFPPDTIHVVVVDPGVGSERSIVIADTNEGVYLAPDNGVLTLPLVARLVRSLWRVTEKADAYCLPDRSRTFHGRDVFAPLAAHLANGVSLQQMGEPLNPAEMTPLTLPHPLIVPNTECPTLHLHVLYADRFGNLVTDLTPEYLSDWINTVKVRNNSEPSRITFQAGNARWQEIAATFSDVPIGSPLAYWGSGGQLEIGIRNGSAAQRMGLVSGDLIMLSLEPPE